jgi:hypothetical protein
MIINNGTVQLGVKDEGHLGVDGGTLSADGATTVVGVRYMPTNGESTAQGCVCEGWGVADAVTGETATADEAAGGVINMSLESFDATASTVHSPFSGCRLRTIARNA